MNQKITILVLIFKTFISSNKVVMYINESENNDSGVESSNASESGDSSNRILGAREASTIRRREWQRRYRSIRSDRVWEQRIEERDRSINRLMEQGRIEEANRLREEGRVEAVNRLRGQSSRSRRGRPTLRSRGNSNVSMWDNMFVNRSSSSYSLPSVSQVVGNTSSTMRPIYVDYSNVTLPSINSLVNTRPDLVNTQPVNSNDPPLIMECRRGWVVNHPPVSNSSQNHNNYTSNYNDNPQYNPGNNNYEYNGNHYDNPQYNTSNSNNNSNNQNYQNNNYGNGNN